MPSATKWKERAMVADMRDPAYYTERYLLFGAEQPGCTGFGASTSGYLFLFGGTFDECMRRVEEIRRGEHRVPVNIDVFELREVNGREAELLRISEDGFVVPL